MPRDDESIKIRPWADTGDRVDPDDSSLMPPIVRATGWPASFSSAGGNTPRRQVFNQILREITGMLAEINQKGVLEWDSEIDYAQNAVVQAGGGLHVASVATGPTTGNATDPTAAGQSIWGRYGGRSNSPSAITVINATAGNGRIDLTWECPLDGGSVITSYTVQWRVAGGAYNAVNQATLSAPLEYVIDGLQNGQGYEVRIRAHNANGDGAWSANVPAAPRAGAPDDLQDLFVRAGNSMLEVNWHEPDDNGDPITGYQVQWKSGAQAYSTSRQATVTGTSHTITGLAVGTSYDIRVRASNSVGSSGWTEVDDAGTPVGFAPGSVSGIIATPASNQLTVAWVAAPDNGSPIIDYTLQWREDGQAFSTARQATVTGLTRTITGLSNNQRYAVRVRARNAIGSGPWVEASGITVNPATADPVVRLAGQIALPAATRTLIDLDRSLGDVTDVAPVYDVTSDPQNYSRHWRMAKPTQGQMVPSFLYMADGGTPSGLYSVDPSSGTATRAGDFGVQGATGLASHNGTLYMVNGTTRGLYSVHPVSGVATLIGNTGIGNSAGLASHNGTLYMVAGGPTDRFYSVNPSTGVATLIGALGASTQQPMGLASQSGTLYAVDNVTKDLLTIDASTGAATVIGDLGLGQTTNPMGLASHNGTLYMADDNTNSLYSVNPSTGVATLIGALGTFSPRGLASHSPGAGIQEDILRIERVNDTRVAISAGEAATLRELLGYI